MIKDTNKSKLTESECVGILADISLDFSNYNDQDLDLLYKVAFSRWAYHLTRDGYIHYLNGFRAKNIIR